MREAERNGEEGDRQVEMKGNREGGRKSRKKRKRGRGRGRGIWKAEGKRKSEEGKGDCEKRRKEGRE